MKLTNAEVRILDHAIRQTQIATELMEKQQHHVLRDAEKRLDQARASVQTIILNHKNDDGPQR